MGEITDIVTNLKGWLDDWRDIEADCVGLQRQLRIEQKEVLRRAIGEIEQLRKCRDLMDGLEKIFRDEFQSLAEKSDGADTDAFKYIYANQAIGVDKALKVLQGARQLLHI